MWEEKGPVVSLEYFPRRTNPFWNMKHRGEGVFNKVDVILYGQETIGSAERSSDVGEMREMFYSIEDGKYCRRWYRYDETRKSIRTTTTRKRGVRI
jgi:hypothetical protein